MNYEQQALASELNRRRLAYDAEGPKHDPKNGQFTSGGGGSAGSSKKELRAKFETLKEKNAEAFAKARALEGSGASGEGRKALLSARAAAGEANKAMNEAFSAWEKAKD